MQFVKTREEADIVHAVEKGKMIANSTPEEILKVVAKWRVYIGIPKNEVSEELAIITEFIYKNYGHMTLHEVELAYNLCATGKLDKVEFFGYFSPMYCGKVLSAYLHYRKVLLTDAIRDREKKMQAEIDLANKPTPEEQCELTRDILGSFYKEYKQSGDFTDMLSLCYNHLRKWKLLTPSKEQVEAALKYANETVDNYKVKPKDREFEIKVLGRKYVVQRYFDTISYETLLNNIKPEHFT